GWQRCCTAASPATTGACRRARSRTSGSRPRPRWSRARPASPTSGGREPCARPCLAVRHRRAVRVAAGGRGGLRRRLLGDRLQPRHPLGDGGRRPVPGLRRLPDPAARRAPAGAAVAVGGRRGDHRQPAPYAPQPWARLLRGRALPLADVRVRALRGGAPGRGRAAPGPAAHPRRRAPGRLFHRAVGVRAAGAGLPGAGPRGGGALVVREEPLELRHRRQGVLPAQPAAGGRGPMTALVRLLALVAALAAGGCATLGPEQGAAAARVAAQAQSVQVDCDREDACATPSPLRALGREAVAASAPDAPRHHALILDYGQDALLARLSLVRSAQRSIEVQTYIFDEDDAGHLFLDELLAAARRGVRVRVLVDQLSALREVETLAAL